MKTVTLFLQGLAADARHGRNSAAAAEVWERFYQHRGF